MSFPRYPKYKDSGVEWLGEVPEHWDMKRIGYYFNERREKVSDKDFPALSVTKNGIVPQLDTAAKSDDGDNRKKVLKGDFVINSRSDRKGSAGASELNGSVSLICTVLRPQEQVHTPFVHHLLRCQPFQEEFYRNGKGIVADLWSTNYSEMRNILLGMPPLTEQTQIATFLDSETAKIDELVAEQRRLMELLKEKRQAVISRAVTQGLNPDAPMKPSGIEWLGDVPEHWGIGLLGYLSSIQTGSTPDRAKPEYWEGDIPWLKTGEINYERILDSEERITEAGLANSAARIAEVGTLMMAMYGQGVTRGRVAILGIRAAYNQACAAIALGPRLCNEYAKYFFMMAYRFIRDTGNETSQMNLGSGTIAKIKILIPPMEEQKQIVSFFQDELSVFDTLTAEAQRAIDLLQERRTALISAAVTGQIDVRPLCQ